MQTHGHTLSEGQLQQLQWVMPTAFSQEFRAFMRSAAPLGAKLRVTIADSEHWLGVFDLDRMVDEVLRGPNTLSRFPRLLPFAGCGRQRTTVYLVDVIDLRVWMLESGRDPVALGSSLVELWARARVEPRVKVRRRLPTHVSKRQARPSTKALRPRVIPPCARTLSLFS